MIAPLLAIVCGIVLLSGLLGGRRNGAPRSRAQIETVIGVVALVVGVLHITSVVGVALIVAGLVLAASAMRTIPRVGNDLQRAGHWLSRFRVVVGLFVLLVGVVSLLARPPWAGPPNDRGRGPPPGVPARR